MTGKTLRATMLTASIVAFTLGMSMLTAPAPTGNDHTGHIMGAGLLIVGTVIGFIREQIKEEQAAADIKAPRN